MEAKQSSKKRQRLVIIDGMSVFYRGYFAMPGLSKSDGTPTGGVFGFASIAIEVIKQLEPDFVAVAWDIRGSSTGKRREIYADYKAGRTKPPDDFYVQLPLLHGLLDSFGWPLLELENYEADDIMGTLSLEAASKGYETAIVTGDYDMMQLISPNTNVYITKKGSELLYFDDAAFTAKYGVRIDQFVDYKALVGDTSDNIPGVRKIGPKAAEKLLGQYDTLDGIYTHIDDLKGAQKQYLIDDERNARMSQQLAQIFCDAPISLDWDEADIQTTHLDKVALALKELEFGSLVKRLPKHMQQTIDSKLHFEEASMVSITEVDWPEHPSIDGIVALLVEQDTLWVAFDDRNASQIQISQINSNFWAALSLADVVSYDIKQLYHDLARADQFPSFAGVHDIRQAAFLLDPLRRDRSLEGLIDQPLDSPLKSLAAIRQLYAWQQESFTQDHNVGPAWIARELDFPLTKTLFSMEHAGIKIDRQFLGDMSQRLGTDLAECERQMHELAGIDFNIGSPAQLADVLFTKLQLPTGGIKKGKTGYSTGQKELDKLRGLHPIIELIERSRELSKLKNTYVDALPKLADANSRVHTTFNQDVAATGRLSSTDPNLQNIPIRTELGRSIRNGFTCEPGKVLVSADYSQFELRLAAILSGDTNLIADFEAGLDIHTKTASDSYGVPIDHVTKDQRRAAKVINFGVLYGMSPHGLSIAAQMSLVDAKKFIDDYFTLRAPVRKFIDDTLEKAKRDGYVETLYGRRRPTPDINSANFMVREGAKRAAANMPIQGTEADLMKKAMLHVDEYIEKDFHGQATQILQIHDSILIECDELVAAKVGEMLKTTMETIAPDLGISLKVDVSQGKTWGEL